MPRLLVVVDTNELLQTSAPIDRAFLLQGCQGCDVVLPAQVRVATLSTLHAPLSTLHAPRSTLCLYSAAGTWRWDFFDSCVFHACLAASCVIITCRAWQVMTELDGLKRNGDGSLMPASTLRNRWSRPGAALRLRKRTFAL